MFFSKLLGVEPYVASSFYVGFKIGDLEVGLDPSGHRAGATVYYLVDNLKQSLQSLLDAGAQIQQDAKDIGGDAQTVIVRDVDGNLIGLFGPKPA
jgi:predicted enzyme related to lactoylglutathione lyase